MDQGLPFIQRLRIESVGNVLEDVDEYGKLHSMMMQHQLPSEYSENVGECQGFTTTGTTTLQKFKRLLTSESNKAQAQAQQQQPVGFSCHL